MAAFSYRATTMAGAAIDGVVEALDEKAAVERLRSMGLIPLKLTPPGSTGLPRGKAAFGRSKGDLLTFTTELSVLLSAGLPLDRSLNILSGLSEGREMKGIVQSILRLIREGSSFSDALQKHPRAFPRLYVNMVKAGEAGGVLDVVLDKLNEFLESTKELKDHITSAMIYPLILSITGAASIVVLLTFVIPKFSELFTELGSVPVSTQILLAFSNALRSYWWAVASVLAAAIALVRAYVRTPKGGFQWDSLKLRLAGDLVRKLETARFCRTLGTLLKSGVSFLQAFNNAKDVITNRVIASSLEAVAKGAKEGKGIAAPLSDAGVFPPLALSMIRVGEETGQLETMLLRVATVYERSLKESVKRFIGFLEPTMILGMGLIIGFIVISMLLAVFSITDVPL